MDAKDHTSKPGARCPLRSLFGGGLGGRQNWVLLVSMTVIVVLVIVLMCPDVRTALRIIAALLALAAVACCLMRGAPAAAPQTREGYFPLPGAPAPHAVASMTPPPADAGHYPGAIDVDEYDTEGAYGHRDLTEGDGDEVPEGNPYNTGRVAYPPAGEACVDDEANDAEMDGDELNTYHARARNDETRVEAGTMNRRKTLDKYFREEVEIAEDREWWGRHEE